MKHEDIIKLAQEVGFEKLGRDIEGWVCFTEEIEHFANLVAAAEREECAKVCDELQQQWRPAGECADAIRARGNT